MPFRSQETCQTMKQLIINHINHQVIFHVSKKYTVMYNNLSYIPAGLQRNKILPDKKQPKLSGRRVYFPSR